MLYRFILTAALCLVLGTGHAQASIIINEFLADPASGLAGDANGDGVRSTSNDEFIEIHNTSDQAVDLTAWLLADATKTRHVFSLGTELGAYSTLVIFGGGAPALPGIDWQISSTGALSLNNSGGTIFLLAGTSEIMDQIVYGSEANHNQSLTLSPEGGPGVLVAHTDLPNANGLLFSPGYLVTPPNIPEPPDPQASAVPEPLSVVSLALGLAFAGIWHGHKD